MSDFNELQKIIESQQKLLDEVTKLLPSLEKIEKNLKSINDSLGYTERSEEIREEIRVKGWNIISKIKDPNINKSDLAAIPLWELYKFIYEDMKKKGEIK